MKEILLKYAKTDNYMTVSVAGLQVDVDTNHIFIVSSGYIKHKFFLVNRDTGNYEMLNKLIRLLYDNFLGDITCNHCLIDYNDHTVEFRKPGNLKKYIYANSEWTKMSVNNHNEWTIEKVINI